MYSGTIDIAATPARVFSVLTDPTLLKQWQPEVIEAQLPEGGLRVGAVGRALVEEFGRRFSVQLVVAAFEPNAKLAYEMTTPLWRGRVEWVLTPRLGCTNVSFLLAPAPPKSVPSLIARVMVVLTRPLIMRKLRVRLKALRRVVDAKGPDYLQQP
jgi:uncharacterized protein YndB with AHSA1/START domain